MRDSISLLLWFITFSNACKWLLQAVSREFLSLNLNNVNEGIYFSKSFFSKHVDNESVIFYLKIAAEHMKAALTTASNAAVFTSDGISGSF